MTREEFFNWLNTCPTHKWDIIEIEGEYCRVLFPIDDDKEANDEL
tara:strand:+ start:1175 stop:1309 length:135 start_codon:yes stop_codon:yes gene_type:complete